ncbi:MAG: hypothetical protein JNM93_00050 [Bacteriovoracaceae bacterium]|nr:hypothetical protein [Bacteriovoracaceae bacterium]
MRNLMLMTFLFLATSALAQNPVNSGAKKNVKIKYKSHTQLDFTGEKIEGKVKAPSVFYIFQRKRSLGHQVSLVPKTLGFHDAEIKHIVKEALE